MDRGIWLAQDRDEFRLWLRHVEGASRVLEIGSRFGYSMLAMAMVMNPRGTIVSVDKGPDEELMAVYGDRGQMECWAVCCDAAKSYVDDVVSIEGDSLDELTVKEVMSHGPFDVVFIDGDHKRAHADYLNYGVDAKVCGFHDIAGLVADDWSQIKRGKRYCEYVFGPKGIGVLV